MLEFCASYESLFVFLMLIVGFATLIVVILIEINSQNMKNDVWGCINDLAMFLNYQQIIRLKKEEKLSDYEMNDLIKYWIVEHENNPKKLTDKQWQVKYDKAFEILKSYLNNQISPLKK